MVLVRERRLFERIKGTVNLHYTAEGNPVRHYAATRNISGGGIRIKTHEQLKPGTVLCLEIFNEKSGVSAISRGTVVWSSMAGSGDESKRLHEAGIRFLGSSLVYIGSLIKDLI